jgi:hypothetical protein
MQTRIIRDFTKLLRFDNAFRQKGSHPEPVWSSLQTVQLYFSTRWSRLSQAISTHRYLHARKSEHQPENQNGWLKDNMEADDTFKILVLFCTNRPAPVRRLSGGR